MKHAPSPDPSSIPMPLITTPFGFHSTATEVIAGVDLTGKRVIVTGGAAGIGIETARATEDCNEAKPVTRRSEGFTGCAVYAVDPDNAERLWERSVEISSIKR